MSSNVLFDASSIGLFHECSSLLKKKKVFFILFHIKKKKKRFDFLKLSTNLDLFIYKIDLIFLHTNQKPIYLFYFVSKQI